MKELQQMQTDAGNRIWNNVEHEKGSGLFKGNTKRLIRILSWGLWSMTQIGSHYLPKGKKMLVCDSSAVVTLELHAKLSQALGTRGFEDNVNGSIKM